MPAFEPTLERLSNPVLRYFLATRPAFLSLTFVGALVGLASAVVSGVVPHPPSATLTVLFALVAHAGVNVINDYYDALNGTDAVNVDRLYPFTGGSRFIQNGVLSLRETAVFGATLFGVVMVAGVWLMKLAGPGLFWIGASGLFVGWAYSAPPLKLNARGLGDVCVVAGYLLIGIGTDFVQRHALSWQPLFTALPFALLAANILYINQFPDHKADGAAGKKTLVVRLGPGRAARGYALLGTLAYAWLAGAVALGILPWPALAALLPAPLTFKAARILRAHADTPSKLLPALQMTIAATLAHGTLLAAALALATLPGGRP